MHLPCSRLRLRPPARPLAALACAGALLGLLGCGDDRVLSSADSGSSTGHVAPGSTSGSTSNSGSASTGTTSSSTTAADDTSESSGSSSGALFFAEPDVGRDFECDTYAQNCPAGQKCTAWANDGGTAWNATRCVPVVDAPVGPGEPCHMEGPAASGLDDCVLGSMCFRVDPKTMEGVCFPFCLGSEPAPTCEDPGRACHQGADGALNLCLPVCDPLAQDCPADETCIDVGHWTCAPDDSGDAGVYGDPCEFINRCDPGLICLYPGALPPGLPCEGAAGCCTEVCDLADPLGDMQCMGAAEGVICQPWYEEDAAPPGYEQVGACALPQ